MTTAPPSAATVDLVRRALSEDIGAGDITTQATIRAEAHGHATVVAKQNLCLAGATVANEVFRQVDPHIVLHWNYGDGDDVPDGATVCEIDGPLRPILTGERVFLNFLGHLSGVATQTRAAVRAAGKTHARVFDTRKTTPGMRALEKAAVRAGGGHNHRLGLDDEFLIKENHVQGAGGIKAAIAAARHYRTRVKLICEVRNLHELSAALEAAPDVILLDNFSMSDLAAAVKRTAGKVELEASGGVTLENIGAVAATGVDRISCGMLTHSARTADLSLLVTNVSGADGAGPDGIARRRE